MKEDLRVLFIAHSAEIGGAEKSLIELIKGLIKRGVFCNVALPAEGSLANEFRKISVPVEIVCLPWCADGEKKYDRNRIDEIGKSTLEIIKILKKRKPDIVYTNSSVIFQGAIASKMLGIKHVWHIREFGEDDYGIDFYLPINERAKFIYDHSDKIIFISNALKDYYHDYIPDNKSEIIYNNVKISNDIDGNVARKDEYLNLLMVGNVHPAKGQLDAVKAVNLLKNKGVHDVRLKIVGRRSSEYYKEISEFIEKNNLSNQIEFYDFVSNPANFFKETDVFLMCSRSEGFGRVTVEAMLFGKPVIGVCAGGTKELIEDGRNGLFYEVENAANLAEKIMFFHDNREKINEFGKNGKIFCERNFSDEKYIGGINDIIVKLKNENEDFHRDLFLSVFNEVEHAENVLEEELNSAKTELANVYGSYTWKIISFLQKILTVLIPEGSRRRKTAIVFWRFFLLILRTSLRAAREIKSGIYLCQNYIISFKPRKKRKINRNSKKIAYIGHSYHSKTKSTVFLIDYLKQFYDVEMISDESWLGKQFPDLSFIDESYLGVIFFQLLPPKDVLKNIKNKNIIFFPMYDQSGRLGFNFWVKCRDIKIASFSKTLHEKLMRWRFDSMYIQYFPDPQEFIPGNNDEVFFWQRLTEINVRTILALFGKENLKIHIHKATDPFHKFIEPSGEDEKKFQITYSDWFETREEMWNLIKQKGIYIAPREYEGIGMSFLEAMAMGKAVVAADNPTMNEYIEHGKNGYLFDLKDPKKINFSDIEKVQKNTHVFMQEGYEKWEKEKHAIIDFIGKE